MPIDAVSPLISLLGLLADMYPSPELDVRQRTITPRPIPNTPWQKTPWGTPQESIPTPPPVTPTPQGTPEAIGGGGFGRGEPGKSPDTSTAYSGPMSPGLQRGMGLAGLAGLPGAPFGLAAWGSRLANWAGVRNEANPMYSSYTPQDIQDIRDYYGAFAAEDAARAAAERAADIAEGRVDPTGRGEPGWGTTTGVASGFGAGEEATSGLDGPSASAAGGFGPGGAEVGSDTSGGSPDSGGRSETGGQGASGNDGMWARGGVSRVRKPTGAVYGEPGTAGRGKSGETAIFVPEMMKRAGIQGREREVIRTLKSLIQLLEGGQQQRATPAKASTAKEREHGGRRE